MALKNLPNRRLSGLPIPDLYGQGEVWVSEPLQLLPLLVQLLPESVGCRVTLLADGYDEVNPFGGSPAFHCLNAF